MFGKLKSLFKKKEKDIVAIVTIERQPRLITNEHVENICRSLGIQAKITEEQTSYIRIIADGWNFVMFSLPIRYLPFQSTDFRDLRMNQMNQDHSAYFVVECIEAPTGEDRKKARKTLALITASLIDSQSMAIYDWTTARYAVLNPELIEILGTGEIDQVVDEYSAFVVGVQSGKLEGAVREARDRWPEFCEAFNRATKRDHFIVKAAFTWNDHVEHMWIEPTATHPDRVVGILMSSPINMPKPRQGDHITRSVSEISDWAYLTESGDPVGMFTEAIVRESMNGQTR